jgi:hypothetical protein
MPTDDPTIDAALAGVADDSPDDPFDPDAIANTPEDSDQLAFASDDAPDHDPFVDDVDEPAAQEDGDDDDDADDVDDATDDQAGEI